MSPAARPLLLLCLATASAGCASLPAERRAPPLARLAVLTPRDAVPIRALDALTAIPAADPGAARTEMLERLRADWIGTLRARGVDVVEISPLETAVAADFTLDTELVAYGDVRRSWLWLLGAQALLAGLGHGIVVSEATHDSTLAWEAGGGEFLLETVTWVGGALVGGRLIDPVVLRVRLIDNRSATTAKRWTREGLRPWRQWLRRGGLPARADRLRGVADRVFDRLAPRIVRALERGAAAT